MPSRLRERHPEGLREHFGGRPGPEAGRGETLKRLIGPRRSRGCHHCASQRLHDPSARGVWGEARRDDRGGQSPERAEGQSPEPSDRAEFELFASAAQHYWVPSLDVLPELPPDYQWMVVRGPLGGAGAGSA